jgi:hypothetical protein
MEQEHVRDDEEDVPTRHDEPADDRMKQPEDEVPEAENNPTGGTPDTTDDDEAGSEDQSRVEAKVTEALQEPNVRLAASKVDSALPEGTCNIGMETVEIPDVKTQLAGFYTENASTLVGQYPQYKFMQKKGQAHGQTVKLS